MTYYSLAEIIQQRDVDCAYIPVGRTFDLYCPNYSLREITNYLHSWELWVEAIADNWQFEKITPQSKERINVKEKVLEVLDEAYGECQYEDREEWKSTVLKKIKPYLEEEL